MECDQMCGATFHSCKKEDHLYICPNTTTSCTYHIDGCKWKFARKHLLRHLQVHQQTTPSMECQRKCGAIFYPYKEEDHLQTCPDENILCTYSGYGCKEQIPRKNLLHHLESHAGRFLSDYPQMKGV